jgi:hypothetical protein
MLLPSFLAMTNDMFLQPEAVGARLVRKRPDCVGRVLSVIGQRARSDSEGHLAGRPGPAGVGAGLTDSREGSGQS